MINREKAKLVGSTLSLLYQNCWNTSSAAYRKLSQGSGAGDKKAIIDMAHHAYGCIFEALDARIRNLKNA